MCEAKEGGADSFDALDQRATKDKKAHKPKFVGFLDESW